MKNILKNLIVALIFTSVLSVASGLLINKSNAVQTNENSYTLTNYDVTAISPSKEQVNSFVSNKEAFNLVFPAANFKMDISFNGKSSNCNFLLSDMVENFEASPFTSKNIVSGKFDEDSVMMDQTLASSLGVSIGSNITFTINNAIFTMPVSGICLPCTLEKFSNGLAIGPWTTDMEHVYKDYSYSIAFMDINNNESATAALKDYIPFGLLIAKDEYIAAYKKSHPQISGETLEEYNLRCETAYKEYYNRFIELYKKSTYTITYKSTQADIVFNQNKPTKDKIRNATILVGLLSFFLLTICNIIVLYTNKTDDKEKVKRGSTKNKILFKYIFSSILFTLFECVIVALVGIICSNMVFFPASSFALIMILLPLMPVAALLVTLPFEAHYAIKLKQC